MNIEQAFWICLSTFGGSLLVIGLCMYMFISSNNNNKILIISGIGNAIASVVGTVSGYGSIGLGIAWLCKSQGWI